LVRQYRDEAGLSQAGLADLIQKFGASTGEANSSSPKSAWR
jgi:hypothetical protein